MNYWFLVNQELTFYFYPHPMLSNFGGNSTVSFMSRSLSFRYHLTFSFYLSFSFSFLFYPFLFSLFLILSPPSILISLILLLPLFSLLFAWGCILATAISIKKDGKGHQCCQGYQYFLLSLEEVTCASIIMESGASAPFCSFSSTSRDNESSPHQKVLPNFSQGHGCYHLVRNYSMAQMFIGKFGEI